MAAETTTPTCEVTGLPLPILPVGLRESEALLSWRPPDRHHAFHRKSHPFLQDIGGIALRQSRIQRVPYSVHHFGYHKIFDGPELTDDEEEKFRLSVIASAGVIPRQAIKISSSEDYSVIDLEDSQHIAIARSTGIESKQEVGKFISEFATKKGLEHILDQFNVDEFLSQKTEADKKIEMAEAMLSIALSDSVNLVALHDKHRTYRKEKLFPENNISTFHVVARGIVKEYSFGYFRRYVTNQLSILQTGVTSI